MSEIVQYMQKQTQAFSISLSQEQEKRETFLKNPLLQLSSRERQVVQLTIEGKSTKETAHILTIAPSTVSTYRRRIMEKLEVPDLISLARLVAPFQESPNVTQDKPKDDP